MTTFADLGLPRPIVSYLRHEKIENPFPIQRLAIPDILGGHDVLGKGPTGSGKTYTFGLPILARLTKTGNSRPGHPRALVLAPTRELAAQIRDRLDGPAASLGLRVIDVVGGVNINTQIRRLAAPVDLLVATPGRAQDLINQKKLSLDRVMCSAVDEADHMADMGFLPQVSKILSLVPKDCQHLLFSATLDKQVQALVDKFLSDPRVHETEPADSSVETMDHVIVHVGSRENRNLVVERIAARDGKTVMFMRTKHGVDRQVKKLRRVGINAWGLHGDKSQGARTAAITGFGDGSVPVLVATDIAARGIDISDVSLVCHIDPPSEHKAYLHRAGRTARAGKTGTVVTLTVEDQEKTVAALLAKAGVHPKTIEALADCDQGETELSSELIEITGARQPSGSALPPATAAPSGKSTPKAGRKTHAKSRSGAPSRAPRRQRRHRPKR